MFAVIRSFIVWYIVVQLITLAALPLTWRLFVNLPDRGYVFAKALGVLLVGFVLWLGTSYGLLRNELGGAWLAWLTVAVMSWSIAWTTVQQVVRTRQLPNRGGWKYVLAVETLFLLAFAGWTLVRAHDPAINHTEQPMDLMFMNSIWASPSYPPHDAWLAGYAVSYYYFGYWLLVTLARMAGQMPEVAYNLGQACWFGLLFLGSFGVGYNLLAASAEPRQDVTGKSRRLVGSGPLWGGLLSAVSVAVTGNLQGILEWLYAQGANIEGLARWIDVRNFPADAQVTHLWFIDSGWWWWRSSRVLRDTDLLGRHMEVIDEFPMFSYLLGDNHPHVLAMPFVLLVLAFALNLFLTRIEKGQSVADKSPVAAEQPESARRKGTTGSTSVAPVSDSIPAQPETQSAGDLVRLAWRVIPAVSPLGWLGVFIVLAATGSLIFMNTWDFPPYWFLLATIVFALLQRVPQARRWSLELAGLFAGVVLLISLGIYLPYFLTAQSQAGGFLPNLFNPTRLPQFLLMFGHFLLGLVALLWLAWRESPPSPRSVAVFAGFSFGFPILFLAITGALAINSSFGQDLLKRLELPPNSPGYAAEILARWGQEPWTLLLVGGLLAITLALLWRRLITHPEIRSPSSTTFALLLGGLGLLLVYAPEFIYLRDLFGTRMNTVFKFYYQGWLLLGLAGSYAIVASLRTVQRPAMVFSGLSLLLIIGALIYPVAGIYSKTGGFNAQVVTLDGLAYVGPNERAAIQWIRDHVPPEAIVLEGKGASYRADFSRMSAATGRPTLLGWDGHESQWRGDAYPDMTQGRGETLDVVYRSGDPARIAGALEQWGIEYVVIGPAERSQYGLPPGDDGRIGLAADLVFDQGDVQIYRRRGPVATVRLQTDRQSED